MCRRKTLWLCGRVREGIEQKYETMSQFLPLVSKLPFYILERITVWRSIWTVENKKWKKGKE